MLNSLLASAYRLLIRPISADEDNQRQEFILNVMLCGTLFLAVFALALVVVNEIALKSAYVGESTEMAIVVLFMFGGLVAISRYGYYKVSAYALTILYLFFAFYSLARWGISLAGGVLVLSLSLVMASVLLGTLTGAVATVVACAGLMTMGYMQEHHLVVFDSSWMKTPGDFSDAIGFSVMLGVITLVSWLSNREIARSLSRAKRSETALTRQRDSLEEKVKERTRELKMSQHEQIMQMARFAEFGRLTSGIVHELVSPLTAISVNLEQINKKNESEKLRRALEGTKRMERYIQAARKQLQNQPDEKEFSLAQEIHSVLDFVAPLAKKRRVVFQFVEINDPMLVGSPIKFHQIMTNLMSNALDAYSGVDRPGPKNVLVELVQTDEHLVVKVQDWGAGIPPQYLDKIFEPFFTLKSSDQGVGLGLSLVKQYVEQEFGGAVTATSDEVNGTVFALRLPLKRSK